MAERVYIYDGAQGKPGTIGEHDITTLIVAPEDNPQLLNFIVEWHPMSKGSRVRFEEFFASDNQITSLELAVSLPIHEQIKLRDALDRNLATYPDELLDKARQAMKRKRPNPS